MIKAGYFYCAI